MTPLCYAKNTDTLADWNVKIAVPDGKTAVLQGSEYYIFGQQEGSIPYVMLRPYRYDDPEKFITDFTEYMQGQYTDLTVTSPATRKTIGNKRCWEIDYGYTVRGYDVRDRRVVITVDGLTYMFASKEIESNGMTIGSMLDDVVAECELLSPGADSVLVEQDYLSAYAPVFDSYLAFLNGAEPDGMDTTERGAYYYVLGETGCSEMVRSGGELGYCLKDLDRNGIPELLIGATGADYYDETLIYDMFTLENGVPVRVLVSSARVRYYLAEEDLILHEGSGGAAYSLSILYFLENGKHAQAVERFKLAVDHSSHKANTLLSIAISYSEVQMYHDALDILQGMEKFFGESEYPQIYPYIAFCYYKGGDKKNYLKYLKESVHLNSEVTEYLFGKEFPGVSPAEYYMYAFRQVWGRFPQENE